NPRIMYGRDDVEVITGRFARRLGRTLPKCDAKAWASPGIGGRHHPVHPMAFPAGQSRSIDRGRKRARGESERIFGFLRRCDSSEYKLLAN
uniref:Transposase n=1 Tax=Macrostomum lignano TaxID=282301 RepID=A0A1I8FB76_9PLAT